MSHMTAIAEAVLEAPALALSFRRSLRCVQTDAVTATMHSLVDSAPSQALEPVRDVARSARLDVRNPLLALPSAKLLQALPAETQAALRALLLDLRDDARVRAERAWLASTNSTAPLASYFKPASIYAQHIARLLVAGHPGPKRATRGVSPALTLVVPARDAARNARREALNPILGMPTAKLIQALPPESLAALRALLLDLREDLRLRAAQSWRKSKSPMAAYHKEVAIIVQHLARFLAM